MTDRDFETKSVRHGQIQRVTAKMQQIKKMSRTDYELWRDEAMKQIGEKNRRFCEQFPDLCT